MILGVADHSKFAVSLRKFLDFASKLKVDVVELRLDRFELLSTLSPHKIRKVKSLLDQYNFKYFVHAPSVNVNLASLNPTLRKPSEKTTVNAVKFAAKINAELVVSHVGRLSRDYPQKLAKKSMKNVIASLTRINSFSDDLGLIFTIENDHKSEDYVLVGYPEQINLLVESIGCKLTFDVGHANTLGKPEEFLSLCKKHIVYVHLHDNNGIDDNHEPIGNGNINFEAVFRRIGNDIIDLPLTVECHSFAGLKESINVVRQKVELISESIVRCL